MNSLGEPWVQLNINTFGRLEWMFGRMMRGEKQQGVLMAATPSVLRPSRITKVEGLIMSVLGIFDIKHGRWA